MPGYLCWSLLSNVLPSGSPFLVFDHKVRSAEVSIFHVLFIEIFGGCGKTGLPCFFGAFESPLGLAT